MNQCFKTCRLTKLRVKFSRIYIVSITKNLYNNHLFENYKKKKQKNKSTNSVIFYTKNIIKINLITLIIKLL